MENKEKKKLLKGISSYCRSEIAAGMCSEGDCAFCCVNDAYKRIERTNVKGENTRVNYLYRDAHNYKVHNSEVISGRFSPEDIDDILDCCEDGECFIPDLVGLPETKFGDTTMADHDWFELSEGSFEETEDEPTVSITADELLSNFRKASDNEWKTDKKQVKRVRDFAISPVNR